MQETAFDCCRDNRLCGMEITSTEVDYKGTRQPVKGTGWAAEKGDMDIK